MDFIYRIPLIDFDPRDEQEIISHWAELLEKVSYSSKSLFQQIQGKNYPDLPDEIKLSLHKYLLRGRYRATPFGKWSAVGIGRWSNSTFRQVDLTTKEIPVVPKQYNQSNKMYGKAPGLEVSSDMVQFYRYDQADQKWAYCLIERNKILDKLIAHLRQTYCLDFRTYSSWFDRIKLSTKKELWAKILETGILLDQSPGSPSVPQTNLKAIGKIQLNATIKEALDQFTRESGALFIPTTRPILEDFKTLFHAKYDDRYIPLSQLMLDYTLLNQALNGRASVSASETPQTSQVNLFPGIQEIHLKKDITLQDLPLGIYDIQYVFHLGKDNSIYLDNILCNRPFVFTGRFSEDEEIFEFSKKLNPAPGREEKYIYCDIQLRESETISFLTRHQNCYTHQLDVVNHNQENSIPMEELYLGIHKSRLVLIWRKKNLTVIPVFQHPLNGQQITLPLFRLLWEISNQDSFKFLPYIHSANQNSSYTPAYTWDSIVVQERKWVVETQNINNPDQLADELTSRSISSPVNAGIMDQELILDWKTPDECYILFKELQKREKLNLVEANSYSTSPFDSHTGSPVFPQFVYQKKVTKCSPHFPSFCNYRDEKDLHSLYFRIELTPHNLIPFLKKTLPRLIQGIIVNLPKLKWYFLLYSAQNLEVRLRFLDLSGEDKQLIAQEVNRTLDPATGRTALRQDSYYPEFEKYSKADIKRSEGLFQWESELMLFGKDQLRPLACSSDDFKVKLISELWSEVFGTSPLAKTYLNQFKLDLKELPVHDIRKIRTHYDGIVGSHPKSKTVTNYIKTLQNHTYYPNPSTQKTLLMNHFHMMVNRFFVLDAPDFEEVVRYVTYRKLGRKIHLRS